MKYIFLFKSRYLFNNLNYSYLYNVNVNYMILEKTCFSYMVSN